MRMTPSNSKYIDMCELRLTSKSTCKKNELNEMQASVRSMPLSIPQELEHFKYINIYSILCDIKDTTDTLRPGRKCPRPHEDFCEASV